MVRYWCSPLHQVYTHTCMDVFFTLNGFTCCLYASGLPVYYIEYTDMCTFGGFPMRCTTIFIIGALGLVHFRSP